MATGRRPQVATPAPRPPAPRSAHAPRPPPRRRTPRAPLQGGSGGSHPHLPGTPPATCPGPPRQLRPARPRAPGRRTCPWSGGAAPARGSAKFPVSPRGRAARRRARPRGGGRPRRGRTTARPGAFPATRSPPPGPTYPPTYLGRCRRGVGYHRPPAAWCRQALHSKMVHSRWPTLKDLTLKTGMRPCGPPAVPRGAVPMWPQRAAAPPCAAQSPTLFARATVRPRGGRSAAARRYRRRKTRHAALARASPAQNRAVYF